MTIVVAIPFFQHLVVIADSRVSYEDMPNEAKVDDILQKIYPVGNPSYGFRMVIGFSGPLMGAYKALERVKATARAYSKPPIATNLLNDMVRWIRYEYMQLDPPDRKHLSFILAGIEPSRDRATKKPSWIPFAPQFNTVTLTPSKEDPAKLDIDSNCVFMRGILYWGSNE